MGRGNAAALQERNLAPELQQAIRSSMSNAVVLKRGRKAVVEDRLKYLDHVYTRGRAYSVWDRLSGPAFA